MDWIVTMRRGNIIFAKERALLDAPPVGFSGANSPISEHDAFRQGQLRGLPHVCVSYRLTMV